MIAQILDLISYGMAGQQENDDVDMEVDSPERHTTPSAMDEKAQTEDSNSTTDSSPASEGLTLEDKASYAAIRPAASNTSTHARPLARAWSNHSVRSVARSHNGYGCDELQDHNDDDDDEGEDDNSSAPASGSDPEAAAVAARRIRSKENKDPFEVYFERGNADSWNPRSMPTGRKWLITGLASSGSFCVTCASSIYTSTYAQMDVELDCSRLLATLGLSTFVLGIALGPMWSPLSEFYGRRPIYLAAFAAFTVWIVPCAVAQNIETVIVARFFQGLSGSAFLSVSGGTVSDLFTPDKMHHPLTLFTAAPFLGPSVGPLLGGFINSNVDWRWTHYIMIIWAACMFLAICFFVPETYREFTHIMTIYDHRWEYSVLCLQKISTDPVILRKKAQQKRKDTGDERWRAPIEKSNKSFLRTMGASLLRPFMILCFEPMALILDVYSAIILGILYLFFGAFPFVFEGAFGFNLWQTGLAFMGLMFGMLTGVLSSGVWQKVRMRLIRKNEVATGVSGKSEPEFRLPSVMAGSVLVTVGLFWFAWTTFSWLHWILPIIGAAIFGVGVSLLSCLVFTCELRCEAERAAAAARREFIFESRRLSHLFYLSTSENAWLWAEIVLPSLSRLSRVSMSLLLSSSERWPGFSSQLVSRTREQWRPITKIL